MPLTCCGSQPSGFIAYGIVEPPSPDSSRKVESNARSTGAGKRWNHADLEAEDCEGGRDGKRKRPNVDTGEHWRIERERENPHRRRLTKDRVDCEPDGEIEDHANHGGGDGRQRRTQRLV